MTNRPEIIRAKQISKAEVDLAEMRAEHKRLTALAKALKYVS